MLGEVLAVDGELLSLTIDGAANESASTGERIPTIVTTKSLLTYWEPVDRRTRFWRCYGEIPETAIRTRW